MNNLIKFLDLQKINLQYKEKIEKSLLRVYNSGWYFLSLPITEKIHNEVLNSPISPVMKPDETEKVVDYLNNY